MFFSVLFVVWCHVTVIGKKSVVNKKSTCMSLCGDEITEIIVAVWLSW